jgi:hypothetical protein
MPSAADLARVDVGATQVQWVLTEGHFEKLVLTVSRPERQVFRREVMAGKELVFDLGLNSEGLDGTYNWELRAVPVLDAEVKKAVAEARKTGNDAAIEKLMREGKMPREEDLVQAGAFTVREGAIVPPDGKEDQDLRQTEKSVAAGARSGGTGAVPISGTTEPRGVVGLDQVIPDDLIVQGSTCIGFDCVNNESFGFDTIRLKENSTRIKFEDTSVGSFPTNDWQLTANDSASGGSSKFSIEDITGAKVPFTITAGASTNSLFIDSTGRMGLRTATPVLDLHINTSNTPALRLEQNNSGGFTAQTWDVAGNEANFFVRDVTGGSRLPFRIRPGAPTSSIDISSNGNVGIGTASPAEDLTVAGSDGGTKLLVQETNGTTSAREIAELRNNGGVVLIFEDTAVAQRWANGTTGANFAMDEQAHAGVEFLLSNLGNLTISGTLTQGSDRDSKTDIVAVSPEDVLTRLSSLPIATWRYKGDDPNARHLGPMAQDFAALFGLGNDDRRIAPLDVAGVSLAAVQALHQQVNAKDAEIAELKQRLANLEALVSTLADAKK